MFLPDLSACGHAQAGGTFLPLPKLGTEPFLKLWEQEVFALLLAEGKITEDVVANMRSWKHSGFSVDQSVRLEAGDQEGVQCLIQYFLRCPFSQARMIEVTEAGKVIYKTEHNAVGRFPDPGDDELLAGPARNFQGAVTQKGVLPKVRPERVPVDSKVVLPKVPRNWKRRKPGHGGSPASLVPVSWGLLFIRSALPLKPGLSCGWLR